MPNSDTTILKALLDAGADPNIPNNKGETCFHSAVSAQILYGSPNDFFPVLINANASLEAKDCKGGTPLFRKISQGDRINLDTLKALLELCARADARDFSGRGLLHILFSVSPTHGTLAVMDLLIEAGADPKAVDNEGDTLLHTIAQGGLGFASPFTVEFFDAFVDRGVPVTAKNHSRRTILHFLPGRSWDGFPQVCKKAKPSHGMD